MRYQAIVYIGRLGREVYTKPRRWKWLVRNDAEWRMMWSARPSFYRIVEVTGDNYKLGEYIRHDDNSLEFLY